MPLNLELVNTAYEAAIFNLAIGVELDVLLELMQESAEADDFETARGINLAVEAWELSELATSSVKRRADFYE